MSPEIMQMYKVIKERLHTVDYLLKTGILGANSCVKDTEIGYLNMLYQQDDCSIGFVTYINGGTPTILNIPDHEHTDSLQYIVVVKGSVLMKIGDSCVRTMKEGECAAIKIGEAHKTIPLTDDAKIAFICIPKDHHFNYYIEKGK